MGVGVANYEQQKGKGYKTKVRFTIHVPFREARGQEQEETVVGGYKDPN